MRPSPHHTLTLTALLLALLLWPQSAHAQCSPTHLFSFGSPGAANGQFNFPQGVAVDASGNIVVADTNNNRIQVFTSAGAHLFSFGSGPGPADGQFNFPQGVAVDASGNIVVADTNNNRIQVFTSAGAHLFSFGSGPGPADGQFNQPSGVVVDASGNIVVADTNNHRIQVFTSAGAHLFSFGSSGTATGQFSTPRGVAVNAAGNIIVADTGNNRIQVFAGCPPPAVANPAVSDQKAGSLLVFPYYTSAADGSFSKSDTLLQITNVCNGPSTISGVPNYSFLHLFFINGANCSPADTFVCLTPNGSIQIKASDYDPTVTGYLVAVAVDAQGRPTQNNCFIGAAYTRVNNQTLDSYGAEAFWKLTPGTAPVTGGNATISLDGMSYDAAPVQFSVQVQDPAAAAEFIILASVSGNLGTKLNDAGQVGAGVLYRADEAPASFQPQIGGGCQSVTKVDRSKIRIVPGSLDAFLKDSYGYLKFTTTPAVGLLAHRVNNHFSGFRTLHKTQVGSATLTAPCFPPFCGF
jgi:DNA-binding beta-propeller fold protein YncE